MMHRYQGQPVCKGTAIGTVKYYKKTVLDTTRRTIQSVEDEIKRYDAARDRAAEGLKKAYQIARIEIGEEHAAIFEVQTMMLYDDDYTDSVYQMIRDNHDNAEYAVAETCRTISGIFSEMDDEYMRARAFDIQDISRRILCALHGNEDSFSDTVEPFILAADDLTPAETVQLDKAKLKAIITQYGSPNSHTAILARSMNIPAVIGVAVHSAWNNLQAVVDGNTGIVLLEPDEQTLTAFRKQAAEEQRKQAALDAFKDKDDCTQSGRRILLYANAGSVEDITAALQNGARGIGLFRSEFLYLGRTSFPSEEELFSAYKAAVCAAQGKKIIIRTLDIGADKQAAYFNLPQEENPALGFRAIRICLEQTALFKTQLRALYRASAFGSLAIMYPMIISVDEVRRIKALSALVRKELAAEHIPFNPSVEEGIMIETPAAVLIGDELAAEVDFFSIGTNDLTQYTLAIDRQNALLEPFYNPHHPAVLKMIQMTVDYAHAHNRWVGICGELAADTSLTETFISMGVDELSVAPAAILPVRKTICETP